MNSPSLPSESVDLLQLDTDQFNQKVLSQCLLKDRHYLQKLSESIAQRRKKNKPSDRQESKLISDVEASRKQLEQRRLRLPNVSFPEELPVAQRREGLAEAIKNNQVVVVAGETGSGKTTQLPKICLELGLGIKGMIGHTQPRRLAARTVAARIAEELQVELGESVGYQVRFSDHSTENTHIKLMTDGILLAEIGADRFLNRYDTLIIDEAHERSLNIDFLLGYLKQLLPRRPDLKIIITSATIDVERLSKHFDNAPIVLVSGRTYPVELCYRPFVDEVAEGGKNHEKNRNVTKRDTPDDLVDHIVNTIDEIVNTQPRSTNGGDDILIFLAGEREIRETAQAIRKASFFSGKAGSLEVLPLYARLSLKDQQQVFKSHKGRRIVLATNVAETSITVPGIRYVIDPGYARISRYSYRTKVLRLPVEAISQASANQRMGRCGRVSNGVCYRLYSEEDFLQRSEFNEPEILRSNLASVILQMSQLRLGDIKNFPFVDMPDHRLVNDGYKLLEELKAFDKSNRLTNLGKKITQFSVDPRFARTLLAAQEQNCLREMLVIVSGLTIQDPRDRPSDKKQAADEQHRRFWHEQSDFLNLVQLWDYVEQQRQDLSQNQFRRLCQKEFLSFVRLREWRDLHFQLRLNVKRAGLKENVDAANYEAIHRALLSGLLSNIGQLDYTQGGQQENKGSNERQKVAKAPKGSPYLGPRNRNYFVFPGSSQFKNQPKWMVAAELIETSKLFAHTVAKVEPEWVLSEAEHLVKRSHSEPHYDSRRGQVVAFERVTLYGLPLIEKRRVNFSVIDPTLAKEIFIRSALVEGRYRNPKKTPDFFEHNQALMEEALELEAKSRRRDLLVNDEDLYRFFDERIPETAVNNRSFDAWRKKIEQEQPELLFLPRSLVLQDGANDVTEAQFPDYLESEGNSFPLVYHFAPSHQDDGVSIQVPLQMLHLLPENRLQWLVPGLLRDKCIALIKALPKQWRKHFVPVPETVDELLPELRNSDSPLAEAIAQLAARRRNIIVPATAWNQIELDAFYLMNIQVMDEKGKRIDSGRHLKELRDRYRDRLQESLSHVGESAESTQITQWDFGDLPESMELSRGKITTIGFPALIDNESHVDLEVKQDLQQALFLTQQGLARLVLLEQKSTAAYLKKNIFRRGNDDLRLAFINKLANFPKNKLWELVACAALQQLHVQHQLINQQRGQPPVKKGAERLVDLPRTQQQYQATLESIKPDWILQAQNIEKMILVWSDQLAAIYKLMREREKKPAFKPIRIDIEQQLQFLFEAQFLFFTPEYWLQQYERYLNGIFARIERADSQIQKDLEKLDEYQEFQQLLLNYIDSKRNAIVLVEGAAWLYWKNPELLTYRWMLEECRISLFAQPMKTLFPISAKRLQKQWQKVLAANQD